MKSHSKLTLCVPYVNLQSNWMTIVAPDMTTILTIDYQTHEVILIPIKQYINEDNPMIINNSTLHEKIVSDLLTEKQNSTTTLKKFDNIHNIEIDIDSVQICVNNLNTTRVSKLADEWFSQYLGVQCSLMIMQNNTENNNSNNNYETSSNELSNNNNNNNNNMKSFSNSGQFLMISLPSVKNLEDKVSSTIIFFHNQHYFTLFHNKLGYYTRTTS